MHKQSRPRGVSIIAILIIIAGVLSLLFGIGLVVIGPFLMNGLQTTSSNLGSQIGPHILGLVFLVFGGILLGLGVANLVMAYGLWKGKGWAWTISIIVLFIGIAINILSVSITGVFSNTGQNLYLRVRRPGSGGLSESTTMLEGSRIRPLLLCLLSII
jgi:glucan phosphoethanolaminetransferase (alkaline phosphatase superfamily)